MNALKLGMVSGLLGLAALNFSCSRLIGYAHRPTDDIVTGDGLGTSLKRYNQHELDLFKVGSVLFVPSVGGDEMFGDGVIRIHLQLFSTDPSNVEIRSIEVSPAGGNSNGNFSVAINKRVGISQKRSGRSLYEADLVLLENLPIAQRRKLSASGGFSLELDVRVADKSQKLKFRIDDDTRLVVP